MACNNTRRDLPAAASAAAFAFDADFAFDAAFAVADFATDFADLLMLLSLLPLLLFFLLLILLFHSALVFAGAPASAAAFAVSFCCFCY